MDKLVPSSHEYLRPFLWDKQIELGAFSLRLSLKRSKKCTPMSRITNRVASLRVERGVSRLELAHLLDIHPATMVALEDGDYVPGLGLAMRVSAYFSLPIDAIFSSVPDEDIHFA